jgi:hypothetical protein
MTGTDDIAPLRTVLIERVRRDIADGTYETPERIDGAVDKVLGVLVDEASDEEAGALMDLTERDDRFAQR